MADREQISVWLSAESAERLRTLARCQRRPLNHIIEAALSHYAASDTGGDASGVAGPEAGNGWRAALAALAERVAALESTGEGRAASEPPTRGAASGLAERDTTMVELHQQGLTTAT